MSTTTSDNYCELITSKGIVDGIAFQHYSIIIIRCDLQFDLENNGSKKSHYKYLSYHPSSSNFSISAITKTRITEAHLLQLKYREYPPTGGNQSQADLGSTPKTSPKYKTVTEWWFIETTKETRARKEPSYQVRSVTCGFV